MRSWLLLMGWWKRFKSVYELQSFLMVAVTKSFTICSFIPPTFLSEESEVSIQKLYADIPIKTHQDN